MKVLRLRFDSGSSVAWTVAKHSVYLDILCCEPSDVRTEFTRAWKNTVKFGLGATGKSRRGEDSCKVGVGRMSDLCRKKSAGTCAADARNEAS